MTTYDDYALHYELLSFHRIPAINKLSAIGNESTSPIATIRGTSDLLLIIGEKMQETDWLQIEPIVTELTPIANSLRDTRQHIWENRATTEEKAQKQVDMWWEMRKHIPHLREIADNLSAVVADNEQLSDGEALHKLPSMLTRASNHLAGVLDVLASPDLANVPDEVIKAHSIMRPEKEFSPDDMQYLENMLQLLDFPLINVRREIATTLRHYTTEESINGLIHLLADPSSEVITKTADSIAHLKRKARRTVPVLIQCLQRDFEDMSCLGHVAEALRQMRDERAIVPLITLRDKVIPMQADIRNYDYLLATIEKAIDYTQKYKS